VSSPEAIATELGIEKAARQLDRGDGRLALAELDALARTDPQATGRPEWWHLRARAVSACGDRAGALEGTARALAIWPGQPEFLQLRADLMAEDGRLAEAEDLARELLRDQPDHPLALATYAMILSRGGEHDAAERLLSRALAQAPEDQGLLSVRYALATAAGVPDAELDRQFDGPLAAAPEDPNLLHMESWRALSEGRREDARIASASAARSMPSDGEITGLARHLAVLDRRSMWLIRQTHRRGWRGAWPYGAAFAVGTAVTFSFAGAVGGVAAIGVLWAYCRYWPGIVIRRGRR
jgi:predicted Zn-dependent protease